MGIIGMHREEKCKERSINLSISYSILVDTVEYNDFNPLETVLKDKNKTQMSLSLLQFNDYNYNSIYKLFEP